MDSETPKEDRPQAETRLVKAAFDMATLADTDEMRERYPDAWDRWQELVERLRKVN